MYYKTVLHTELQLRKQKNSRYSLRAFASHLELHPSALSRILASKQELSVRAAILILQKVEMDQETREKFIVSVAQEKYRIAIETMRTALVAP